MSQSPHVHHERLSPVAIEAVIELVREQARRFQRCGPTGVLAVKGLGPSAQQLRDVIEFLLRPTAVTVGQLAAMGCLVEGTPKQRRMARRDRLQTEQSREGGPSGG